MRSDWHGLIKVLEIQHVRNGKVIWEDRNLYNMLHTNGEEFLLTALFNNDGTALPEYYYLGLDNRTVLLADQTMEDVEDEPSINGYSRQTLSSASGWDIELHNGVHRAVGNIITFTAVAGTWGPVQNLFLTDQPNNTGYLIASVPLSVSATLTDGDAINMRMALSLRDYPA